MYVGSLEAPAVSRRLYVGSLEAPAVSRLPTLIGIAVVTLLFTIVLVVAIVSSLMWFR